MATRMGKERREPTGAPGRDKAACPHSFTDRVRNCSDPAAYPANRPWCAAVSPLALVGSGGLEWYAIAVLAVGAVALGYLTWHVEPAWLLSVGLVLSTFNSNWELW